MKWRRITIIWAVLFIPLSFYNIFANPIFFPTQPIQYNDPKIQNYNFSMASPIYVTGNFTASFSLTRPLTYYRLSARVHASVDYESYGAYGAFRLLVSVAENGVHHSPNNAEMDFVLPPPVPPSGYGAALNGPLPDTTNKEVFSHLVEGTNTIQLNYTFWSSGIDTQPPKYGPGYFKLDIGPYGVIVTDLVTVYSLGVVSELILAVLVFPFAYGSSILLFRLIERRRASQGGSAEPAKE
jgi:hypothetical protein